MEISARGWLALIRSRSARLSRYQEIPTVGLYLEQTTKYISQYLDPLEENCITSSMIANYVKKGLIANPVKKQYGREQIAYLFSSRWPRMC